MKSCSAAGLPEPDPLLLPFLRTRDEAVAERHLDRLIREHAEPIIARILRRRWCVSPGRSGAGGESPDEAEALDARAEILIHLLTRLRRCRADPDGPDAVRDFAAYVAVTVYRACDEGLRRRHPGRESLRCRIRYLLTHRPELALWRGDNEGAWLCGRAEWKGDPAAGVPERLDIGHLPLAEQLTALFQRAGRPLKLEDLVNAVAAARGVHDAASLSLGGAETDRSGYDAPAPVSVAEDVVRRDYLRHLWSEIRLLPRRQRAALLLNFRDGHGRGILALFALTGIATPRQIAQALEIPAGDLTALWNDLPLDDAAVAAQLGCTRQQVINLRKVARERLVRRTNYAA